MADELATGQCACGNRAFSQDTLVLLANTTVDGNDTAGRKRKVAEDIRKMLTCLQCHRRYIFSTVQNGWMSKE